MTSSLLKHAEGNWPHTRLHSKIERGAQAVANEGVLQVRRSETGRRQRSYMNKGNLVSAIVAFTAAYLSPEYGIAVDNIATHDRQDNNRTPQNKKQGLALRCSVPDSDGGRDGVRDKERSLSRNIPTEKVRQRTPEARFRGLPSDSSGACMRRSIPAKGSTRQSRSGERRTSASRRADSDMASRP